VLYENNGLQVMNIDLTQDDIDRISMMIRREISETEKAKYNHQTIVSINKQKPPLEDEHKEAKKQELIQQHEKVIEVFTKDLELLESIQKKLDE
jgi:glucosamine 6-phosphate synthetase-like amidotransferase/phosphosugar isomerase protein